MTGMTMGLKVSVVPMEQVGRRTRLVLVVCLLRWAMDSLELGIGLCLYKRSLAIQMCEEILTIPCVILVEGVHWRVVVGLSDDTGKSLFGSILQVEAPGWGDAGDWW
jgi:hypothetical protein